MDVLKKKLQQCHLEFPLNSQDTLAMTYMDGLSICENIAMQAVYESQCFPCAFVGGSAGADAPKRHTYIYDGQRTLERSLVICLIKLQPGYRFAAFNTNNIESILKEYTVIDANSTLQTVYKVVDAEAGCQDVIAALKKTFNCESLTELKRALKPYVFGTEIGGRLYARDMRHIEESHNCLHFHCGFAMGEKIMLLKYNGLEQHELWGNLGQQSQPGIAGADIIKGQGIALIPVMFQDSTEYGIVLDHCFFRNFKDNFLAAYGGALQKGFGCPLMKVFVIENTGIDIEKEKFIVRQCGSVFNSFFAAEIIEF